MFNPFTLAFVAIIFGIGLSMFITRQGTPDGLPLVPPESDFDEDPKDKAPLEMNDLFRLAEQKCKDNDLVIKERIKNSDQEEFWITESKNDFFFGNYVFAFLKVDRAKHPFATMSDVLEFKDFVKSVQSSKGFFFTTGYFTRDVLQPLEGPKVTLYNRRKVLAELHQVACKYLNLKRNKMALLKVASMGHPVLRKTANPIPVEEIKSEKIQTLISNMIETMYEYDGRGLAAPQVHESLQLVVMVWDFNPKEDPYLVCLINPEIKPLTTQTSSFWEGCLSLPGLRGKVARPNRVSVSAFNQRGEKVEFVAEGFSATVVQHECDHLLGKLYIDRMTDLTQFAFNKEFQKFHASANESVGGEE